MSCPNNVIIRRINALSYMTNCQLVNMIKVFSLPSNLYPICKDIVWNSISYELRFYLI